MFVFPAPSQFIFLSNNPIKQCADITFTAEPIFMITDCVNSTGVGGEAAAPVENASPPTNSTPTTTSPPPGATSAGAASKLAGSVMVAGILAMFGFIL